MNRLVPDRPALARARRHIGALPHGLPTALVFTVAVAVLMVGSFAVVDKALPVLMRRDADRARRSFDLATVELPPGSPRALMPVATPTASPSAVLPHPDPTTRPQTGASQPAEPVPGHPSTGGSGVRTVVFRGSEGESAPDGRSRRG